MELTDKQKSALIDEGYSVAYTFYQSGKYEEAIKHFKYLLELDLRNVKIWLGLGASLQMQKNYGEAVKAYAMAAFSNQSTPSPHFYAAECFFALKDLKKGFEALEVAEKLSFGHTEYESLYHRVQSMKAMWKQPMEKSYG